MFFLTATTIWALAHGYVAWRLLTPIRLRPPHRVLAWGVVVALGALAPLVMWGDRNFGEAPWWIPFRWAGYVYMGFFTLVFFFSVVRDLIALFARGFTRVTRTPTPTLFSPNRRRFLANSTNLAVTGGAGVLSGLGYVEARRVAAVKRVTVPVPGLPEAFDGYRIAQLTDVHVGPTIKGDWLTEVVRETNQLGAQFIAITGDLVDGFVPELRPHVAPLRDLKAPDGVYFVTGNHEFYWGAQSWCEEVSRLGITVLQNAHRIVERNGDALLIAGVPDYTAHRFHPNPQRSDPRQALAGAPAQAFKVLLAHQPKSVFAAADAGFDLQISGHTHGGQFFPWNFFVHLAQPFTRGLHRHRDLWIYVSPGTGYWGPPTRAGVPSEITLLELRRT